MDNVNEFIKKMGICNEDNIVDDDDYETSHMLDSVSDLLTLVDGGSANEER